jgi:EamA domain-containing membrane protein RarD
LVPATGIAMAEIGSTEDFSAAQWVAVLAASAGVYAAIVLLPLVTLRLIDTFVPRAVGRADFSTNTRPQ